MNKETPIKFKKEYREVTFEIEVNSQTTVEDFRQIKETFDELYKSYHKAAEQESEERYYKCLGTNALHFVFKINIIDTGLSYRAKNVLRYCDINTILDLVQRTKENLLGYRNMGRATIDEIECYLKKFNLHLNMMESEIMSYNE